MFSIGLGPGPFLFGSCHGSTVRVRRALKRGSANLAGSSLFSFYGAVYLTGALRGAICAAPRLSTAR